MRGRIRKKTGRGRSGSGGGGEYRPHERRTNRLAPSLSLAGIRPSGTLPGREPRHPGCRGRSPNSIWLRRGHLRSASVKSRGMISPIRPSIPNRTRRLLVRCGVIVCILVLNGCCLGLRKSDARIVRQPIDLDLLTDAELSQYFSRGRCSLAAFERTIGVGGLPCIILPNSRLYFPEYRYDLGKRFLFVTVDRRRNCVIGARFLERRAKDGGP